MLIGFGFMAMLSGCSFDASISSIVPKKVIALVKPAPGAEFVSGASEGYEQTSGAVAGQQYYIKASAGHYIPTLASKTTGRGYIVFTTVQGTGISEELREEWTAPVPVGSPGSFNP